MKLPCKKSGMIGGQRWRLVVVPTIQGSEDSYAITYPLQNEIHISSDRNQAADQLLDTICHELDHATIYAYGLNKILEAEQVTDRHEVFVTMHTPALITTLKEFGIL